MISSIPNGLVILPGVADCLRALSDSIRSVERKNHHLAPFNCACVAVISVSHRFGKAV